MIVGDSKIGKEFIADTDLDRWLLFSFLLWLYPEAILVLYIFVFVSLFFYIVFFLFFSADFYTNRKNGNFCLYFLLWQ